LVPANDLQGSRIAEKTTFGSLRMMRVIIPKVGENGKS